MPTSVFWPVDVKDSGYVYGWLKPTPCVAGVLKVETLQAAQERLTSVKNYLLSSRMELLNLEILGECTFENHISRSLPLPNLVFHKTILNFFLIYYTRHPKKSLRFYSLEPLRLETTVHQQHRVLNPYTESAKYDFTKPQPKEDGLGVTTIQQFNLAKELEQTLHALTTTTDTRRWTAQVDALRSLMTPVSGLLQLLSQTLTLFCGTPVLSPSFLLKDASATVQQLDVRAEQLDFFVNEIGPLSSRASVPIALYSARYVSFFNTLWLILNDVIIGWAFGAFLCDNHLYLSELLVLLVESFLISWVQWTLGWLDSWPAGLKLNTELSRFYSQTFIDLVATWAGVLRFAEPYLPNIIYGIGMISFLGVTMTVSLFMDVLAIVTAHVYVCYLITHLVYARMLKTLGSLWNLFRGKRYNTLRNRTDSWEYDLDQLLFGTILFTLVAFLFPTVLVYYALFATMRLGTLLILACLETLLAFMNHFPLFALTLLMKDPWRLPGGVYFLLAKHSHSNNHSLILKNKPVALRSVFYQYNRLWGLLASHYNPLRLVLSTLSGRYLAAIPRYSIRYNRLPHTTPSAEKQAPPS